jgi:hypothetical protein
VLPDIRERPPSISRNVDGGPQAPIGGPIPIWDLKSVL